MSPEEKAQQIAQIKAIMQAYGALLPQEYQITINELIAELENPNGANEEKVNMLAAKLFGGAPR